MNTIKLIVLLSLVFLPINGFSGQKLSGDEITSAFSGNTYHWKHTKRSDSGKTFLGDDGKVKSVKNGENRDGGWVIKGDKLCFTTGKKICREVEPNGNGGFYLVKDGSKRVIEILKVEKGNTI